MPWSNGTSTRPRSRCPRWRQNGSAPTPFAIPQPHTCSAPGWTSTPFAPGSGNVSLDTTNIYAEIDLEMKAKALAKCEVVDASKPQRHWRDDPALMTFLREL